MTAPQELLHVLGVAAPGDPATAAARALRDRLVAEGRPGRLVALDVHGRAGDIDRVSPAELAAALDGARAVVHAVDGGEALGPAVPTLAGAAVHLVHHGSRPGSDRRVLRSLRDAASIAAGTDPSAREELRRLGFGDPVALPIQVVAGALDDATAPDDDHAHPGPHLVAIGPIGAGRSLELLVDAFAQLLRAGVPSAVLSICGPADRWYLDLLMRRVLRRGLVACEVVEPHDESTVLQRLRRADVFVSLAPTGLDPYLWHAAGRAQVVAPRVAATAPLAGAATFVELAPAPTVADVVRSLARAVEDRGEVPSAGGVEPSAGPRLRELLGVA